MADYQEEKTTSLGLLSKRSINLVKTSINAILGLTASISRGFSNLFSTSFGIVSNVLSITGRLITTSLGLSSSRSRGPSLFNRILNAAHGVLPRGLSIRTEGNIVGFRIYYGSSESMEEWHRENAKINLKYEDVVSGRARKVTLILANPKNTKDAIYTPYRRIRIIDHISKETVFLGRVVDSISSWDKDYGLILTVTCMDYMYELTLRYCTLNFETAISRSEMVSQIVDEYTTSGTINSIIESSESEETLTKDFSNSSLKANKAIEKIAMEDYWLADINFSQVWRWVNSISRYVSYYTSGSSLNNNSVFLSDSNDRFYIGGSSQFEGAFFTLSQIGSMSGITWEYWNGSWQSLTLTSSYNFNTSSGRIAFSIPGDWALKSMSDSDPHAIDTSATTIDDCETVWDGTSDTTVSLNTSDYQEGTSSMQIDTTSSTPIGILSSRTISVDISGHQYIKFWIKSDIATSLGSLRLSLQYSTSSFLYFDVPALVASTWTEVEVDINNIPNSCPLIGVQLESTIAPGESTILIDDVRAFSKIPAVTSLYWIRASCTSVTTEAKIYSVFSQFYAGYDYRVDDEEIPNFHYFKRGTVPSGGAESNGLTISLTEAAGDQTMRMLPNYNFSVSPSEMITRVTVRGIDENGTMITSTAIRSDLENTYSISNEYVDVVYGETTQTLIDERSQALLQQLGHTIKRGNCSIVGFPKYTIGGTTTHVRAGDLVHIDNTVQGIDEEYVVIALEYEDITGVTNLELLSQNDYGRELPPVVPHNQVSAADIGDLPSFTSVSYSDPRTILFYIPNDFFADTNVTAEIPLPFNFYIERVYIHVKTAPEGGSIRIDVNSDGSSIFTSSSYRPRILSGQESGIGYPSGSANNPILFYKNSVLSIDIDEVGYDTSGEDLTVEVRGFLNVEYDESE